MGSGSTGERGAVRRRWSSRSIGKGWQHRFFYGLIRLGGRRLAYLALLPITAHYALLSATARGRCSPYLSRRFPGHGRFGALVHRYRWLTSLGKVLIDRALIGILGPQEVSIDFVNPKELKILAAKKTGFVILMSHAGSWQAALSVLKFLKKPVNLLLQREEGDVDLHYFEHRGLPFRHRIIDPNGYLGGTLESFSALKRGEVLCMMGDRALGSTRNAVAVDFLGDPVKFPFSAFKLASAAETPVVVLLSSKIRPNAYVLELAGIIRVPPDLGHGRENLVPYVKQYVEMLENFVKKQPYQFFNFYDMWDVGVDAAETSRSEPEEAE